MCYANTLIKEMDSVVSKANDKKRELLSQLQQYDKRISQLNHLIEQGRSANVIKGYRIYKEVQALQRQRRVVKHEITAIDFLLETDAKSFGSMVNRVTKRIDGFEKEFQTYTKNWKKEETIDDVLSRELQRLF